MKALLILPLCLLLNSVPGVPDESSLKSRVPKELFDSDELLNVKLTGNVRDAFGDRSNKPKYHAFSLYYQLTAGESELRVPVKIRTRGHFRKDKSNCTYPPLLLNFSNKDQVETSL